MNDTIAPVVEPMLINEPNATIKYIDQLRSMAIEMGVLTEDLPMPAEYGQLCAQPELRKYLCELFRTATQSFFIEVAYVNYHLPPSIAVATLAEAVNGQDLDSHILQTMPSRFSICKKRVPIVFFRSEPFEDMSTLMEEYEKRDLVSDPYAQIAVNQQFPWLVSDFPNVSIWDVKHDEASYLSLYRWNLCYRYASCHRRAGKEFLEDFNSSHYWYVGVRKSHLHSKRNIDSISEGEI